MLSYLTISQTTIIKELHYIQRAMKREYKMIIKCNPTSMHPQKTAIINQPPSQSTYF
jgi:hypothetical protein